MRRLLIILLLVWSAITVAAGQIADFPYRENFDSVTAPSLPAGWTTTSNKDTSGDFYSSTTSERSSPNCIESKNGKISQALISPSFSFSGKHVDSLMFYERRTSTHRSPLLLEASVDGDTSFSIPVSDTLWQESSTSYRERQFALPALLDNQTNVRFRWRLLADTLSGSTGVIRFDDISITVKKSVDLAITSLLITPAHPREGEAVTVAAGIVNKALPGNFTLNLLLFDSSTIIDHAPVAQFFNSNDSISLQLSYSSVKAGTHQLTVWLDVSGDEDTTNNTVSRSIDVSYPARSLLINEIMYAPNDEPEWVECINVSADTIDLKYWSISDRTGAKTITEEPHAVLPEQFILFSKDSSFKEKYPDFSGTIVQVSSMPTLNNDSDAVVLIDQTGSTIDSVLYHDSWGGTEGRSLERIDAAAPSTDPSNWSTSVSPYRATPGGINSVTQKEYDAAVSSISFSPPFPSVGDEITAIAAIENRGKNTLSGLMVNFSLDKNGDSLADPSELIGTGEISLLQPGRNVSTSQQITTLSQGKHIVIVTVSTARDDDLTNNTAAAIVEVGIPPAAFVVNEIMYAPPGDMPEWVELYNRSSNAVDISGWKISDAGTNDVLINLTYPVIQPNGYLIVTTDAAEFHHYFPEFENIAEASFSALNNASNDAVVVYDNRGAVIDSVFYSPDWGGTDGMSLQRFDIDASSNDSANWIPDSPTPDRENTIARKDYDAAFISLSSNKISHGFRIECEVRNEGRKTINSCSLRLFHDSNANGIAESSEAITLFGISSLAANNTKIISYDWNTTDVGRQNIIGVIDFPTDERLGNDTLTTTVSNSYPSNALVINEIMYEPNPSSAEFVELFNPSPDSIDISEWMLMDTPTSAGNRAKIELSPGRHFIHSHDFFLVASDSSILSTIPERERNRICIDHTLSLSNNGEDIILSDLTGTQIDSIHYYPAWHLKDVTTQGRSLERISPVLSGNDSRNWSSSVASNGSTPLAINSIYTISGSPHQSMTLTPNPFSPDGDGFQDFLSINYALPSSSSRIRVRIYNVEGRLVKHLALDELSPSHGSVIWNGSNDNGRTVSIGMYIILFEALDNFGGVVRTMKDVAVVATKL